MVDGSGAEGGRSSPGGAREVRASIRPADAIWRLALCAAHRLLRLWWWIRRPAASGAAVVVRLGEDILVVETSYRGGVDLPGGGVGRRETPVAAAVRELGEETGIRAGAEELRPLGRVRFRQEGRQVVEHLFELRLREPPVLRPDGREVVAVRWVRPAEVAALQPAPGLALWLAGRSEPES